MTKQEIENKRKFIDTMLYFARENDSNITREQVERTVNTLHRHNATLRTQYCYQVNGEKWYSNKKVISLEARCQALVESLGCNLSINTDPRGYPIEILHDSRRYRFGW